MKLIIPRTPQHTTTPPHPTPPTQSLMRKGLFQVGRGPTGIIKSVLDTNRTSGPRRDEIFVDIVEKLTCTFNSSGYLQSAQIDGAIQVCVCFCGCGGMVECVADTPRNVHSPFNTIVHARTQESHPRILSRPFHSLHTTYPHTQIPLHTKHPPPKIQVKSYLTGNPAIRIALNDDLAIGRREGPVGGYGYSSGPDIVMLDDANFHESVQMDRFDSEHILELTPPDGEFALMNYRSTYELKPPYRVFTTLEEDPDTPFKVCGCIGKVDGWLGMCRM